MSGIDEKPINVYSEEKFRKLCPNCGDMHTVSFHYNNSEHRYGWWNRSAELSWSVSNNRIHSYLGDYRTTYKSIGKHVVKCNRCHYMFTDHPRIRARIIELARRNISASHFVRVRETLKE